MTSVPNGFLREDPWRIFRLMVEFMDAFETLSQVGPAVTIFGSARTKPPAGCSRASVAIARGLPKHRVAIITGGGPGILQAANKGAAEAKGKSVGFNIELPHEQSGNRYADIPVDFHDFTDGPQKAIHVILDYRRRVGPPEDVPQAFA